MRKTQKMLSSQPRKPRIPDHKMLVSFIDEISLIEQLDVFAAREGTDRSALLRRALRRELTLLPAVPTNGNTPQEQD